MEVLAGLGLVGAEIFKYNRENYEFDQDQRFEKEELRLKMQIERFALFREDIRDLVELTVGKMDLYHMVGALFAKMIVIYYSEGFFEDAPPPFLIAFYYVSEASALCFLIMAIWLAMHASITSHSYATRLLTRFIRLPIPGSSQLNILNARYADFERQGMQAMRVPFLKRKNNEWMQRADLEGKGGEPKRGNPDEANDKVVGDFLDEGEYGYGGATDLLGHEDELLHAVEFRTQKHVQIFRDLQAKWQCYDAYARVCMSLGVRQMLQAVSYYLIGIFQVQMTQHVGCYVVIIAFQAMAVTTSILDIHGMSDNSILGVIPSLLAIISLNVAERDSRGHLLEDNSYMITLAMYPLEIMLCELLIWVASPMGDDASLPRQFRAVLFMDVYSDLDDGSGPISEQRQKELADLADTIQIGADRVQSALRRWEAVPRAWLTMKQRRHCSEMRAKFETLLDGLAEALEKRELQPLTLDERSWQELDDEAREADPFVMTVLGPFGSWTGLGVSSQYYWDIDNSRAGQNQFLYQAPPASRLLSLKDAADAFAVFEQHANTFTKSTRAKPPAAVEQNDAENSDQDHSSGDDYSASDDEDRPLRKGKTPKGPKSVRLPWLLVAGLCRCIQLVWVFLLIVAVLRETGTDTIDFQVSFIHEERRLAAVAELFSEKVAAKWPYGAFFRAESVACGSGELLVASPFAQYRLEFRGAGAELSELRTDDFPAAALLFCRSPGDCLLGEPLDGGLTLRDWRRQPVHSWKLLLQRDQRSGAVLRPRAGALIDCSTIGRSPTEEACLLLASQASNSSVLSLGLAALPLSAPAEPVEFLADWELDLGTEAAVTVEGPKGRLWALLSTGFLEAWEFEGAPRQAGRWQVLGFKSFSAAAMCKNGSSFFVAGRSVPDGLPALHRVTADLASMDTDAPCLMGEESD